MDRASVVAIFIAPDAEARMQSIHEVRAESGKGLDGDRYHAGQGTYSRDKPHQPKRHVTLIEEEAIAAVGRDYRMRIDAIETRRNILTRGVALNHLVGREFRVGDALLRGITLCEPCNHLDALTGREVSPAFVHRGGLNAEVLEGGKVRVGDSIEPAATAGRALA